MLHSCLSLNEHILNSQRSPCVGTFCKTFVQKFVIVKSSLPVCIPAKKEIRNVLKTLACLSRWRGGG